MTASHLSSGKINLSFLRNSYRRELLELLDKCTGSKALVWDSALEKSFGLVAEYSLLKEHDVEKMYPLRSTGIATPKLTSIQNVIFITRPNLELMDDVAQSVLLEDGKSAIKKDYHIIFVPRKSLLCEKKLKEAGVYGSFASIEEFNMELLPFDYDLLSLEMSNSFRECYLEKDYTTLFYVARSLMMLQVLYGIIPNIYGKGQCSRQVVDMMLRMRREMAGQEPQTMPQIDNVILIDRNVDLLTPLLSQLTYEGLIDEIFGLHNTIVELPADKFSSPSKSDHQEALTSTETQKFILNSSDELFSELRDRNFNAVGGIVSKKAKILKAQADERHTAKTVGEMKLFVSKLPHLDRMKKSLATQTTIAELIKQVTDMESFRKALSVQHEFINTVETDKPHPYIEDCIAKETDIVSVLRLICVQSFCNNGLKPKVLDYYKRELLQTYGFQHMVTLMNLEKTGFLQVQGHSKIVYPSICKTLKLVVDVNEQMPHDIAYVYSGYAPLSVRLIQFLARPGWRSIVEILSYLPGPTIDEKQLVPVALRKRRGSGASSQSSTAEQGTTLVYFIGGVTYAEIAALRFLAHQDDGGTDYIIATTKIINGKTLLKSVMEDIEPKPINPF